ncbi:MAG: NTP transferase domain-containing protein, partial [Chloroflexi bacterium]|nr:NTP transferase domain-containing protein [Chloroflexota bacterium]
MKALVLCAGKGTRLRPVTHSTPKHLIPVANRTILSYVLQQIADAGIRDVAIVISPDSGGRIREAVGDGTQWGLAVSYVVQEVAGGLAHAVKMSRHFLADSDFLMFLGDNLIEGGVAPLIEEFRSRGPHGLVLLKAVA